MMPSKSRKLFETVGLWASICTMIAVIIAIITWLWPDPLGKNDEPAFSNPIIAQTLKLTEPIPTKDPGSTRILVAKFDEVDQPNFKVTDLLLANLRDALAKYPDTEVVATERVITERDGSDIAIEIGKAYEASIVIWGWYGLTENAVPLGVHFEVIQPTETFHPNSCGVASPKTGVGIRKIDPNKLKNLTLQSNLSNELSYVTIFTLGLARFDALDWKNAVSMFDDAISHLKEETILSAQTEGNGILVDLDLLYYYRGRAYQSLGNFDKALEDFNNVSDSNMAISLAIAQTLADKDEIGQAIDALTILIDKNSPLFTSIAYFERGKIYENEEKYEFANEDFIASIRSDQASTPELYPTRSQDEQITFLSDRILTNPNNPLYYYWRGTLYQQLEKNDEALTDLNKAITLFPDFYVAREARSHVAINENNFETTLQDLNYVFQMKEFYTPCNLHNRGVANQKLGNKEEAERDFTEVVRITTIVIENDSKNAFAYYVRSLGNVSLANRRTLLEKLFLYHDGYYLSLKDELAVRRINPKFAKQLDVGDMKSILLLAWRCGSPFLIWITLSMAIIEYRKDAKKLFTRIKRHR
jgi:tetratricopeptide (TPR) repeat protein